MAQIKSGTYGALAISLIVAAGSAWLVFSARGVYCDQLPSMTILATLAAFVIALCFRLIPRTSTASHRLQLGIALLIGGVTLFGNARFVTKYRGRCNQIERQIRQTSAMRSKYFLETHHTK